MKYQILVLLLSVGLFLQAQGQSFSADQIVDLAIKNSSMLKAGELEAKSKEKISKQAGSWDNPTFEIGTENKKDSAGETKSVRYGISQTLYVPGKFSAKEQSLAQETEISKVERSSAELALRGYILNLVYELKASKEKLAHTEERFKRFRTVENFIQNRVIVSPQKKTEANIVMGKLIVLQKELLQTQAKTENLWQELNLYLKMPTEPNIQTSWFKKGPDISEENLISELAGGNSEIKRQELKLSQAKIESELASLESWPSLSLSGSYSDGSGANPEKVYGLGVAFPFPLFNTNSSNRAATDLKAQAEKERLNSLKERNRHELRAAFLKYEISKKSIAALPIQKITDLEKSMQDADRGFIKGQVDLLTYLEADSQHFESLSAILEAQLDLIKSISELQILTGHRQISLEN